MSAVVDQEILDRREQLLDEELDKFVNGINTSKYRPKSNTWMSIWFKSTPIEVTAMQPWPDTEFCNFE